MILEMSQVISKQMVEKLLDLVMAGELVSGLKTAVGSASRVKHNQQLEDESDHARLGGELLVEALRSNPIFEAATLPAQIVPPRFSVYRPGMRYGNHLDAPLMGEGRTVRTDLAITVFLADPKTYEGGELVIDTDHGIQRIKGGLGDCVIYPANTFHRVEQVIRGERIVAFLWIQSLVRDPAKRKILFDLTGVTEFLDQTTPHGLHIEQLRRCLANLTRMWAHA